MKKLVIAICCIGPHKTVDANLRHAKERYGEDALHHSDADPVRCIIESHFQKDRFSNVLTKLLCKDAYTQMGERKVLLAIHEESTRMIMKEAYDEIVIALYTHHDCAGSPDLTAGDKKQNMELCTLEIQKILNEQFPEIVPIVLLESFYVHDENQNLITHETFKSVRAGINKDFALDEIAEGLNGINDF